MSDALLTEAIWLTLKLASLTTVSLLLIAVPLAWYLSQRRHLGALLLESVVAMPLVLPPTVLGFYLLLAFSPDQALGHYYQRLTGQTLAFSFTGIYLGSLLYSLPFAVQPLQTAFAQFDRRLLEAARTLGASPLAAFVMVVLPVCRSGLLSAALLSFAHTVGEFGVVLMIGGNIPGQTQVLSIALFDAVEALDYRQAHRIALGLLVFSWLILMIMMLLKRMQDAT